LIKNKLLTRPFGALAFGLHQDILQFRPIGVLLAVGWAWLLARAARKWDAQVFGVTAVAVGWVLISVAPLWTFFFVTDTLEGSRYVYLGSSFWSIAVVTLIANDTKLNRITFISATAIVLGCAAIVIVEQSPWREAAALRDRVTTAWRGVPAECDPRLATGLPDSVRGAYVFRNGFTESVTRPAAIYSESCKPYWAGGAFLLEP
jgi:hypothetical protein